MASHRHSRPPEQSAVSRDRVHVSAHHTIPLSTHPSPAMSNGHHPPPAPPPPGPPSVQTPQVITPLQRLAKANEETWLLIGEVAEQMNDLDFALTAYEHALRHNPRCVPALSQVAGIARIKENYPKAIDYFQRVVNLPGHETKGDIWSALGHCYLMQDDLQKAYTAYQQALYHLPNPKEDPKLWYGIGILYDRYGSLDHAEEAFSSVLRMDKEFDKANEILFRLGIIYKQQGKFENSLDCFNRILRSPPVPLAHIDIWFQIGHVYEQQKDFVRAKAAYERVVEENPNHAKVLQQLGWLYHQQGAPFQNQDLAIQYLTKSLEADATDAQSWYLLGRAYMAGQKYNKAYEAYQQAVYRDGRNPTFWCSIGVLYFQINQYRDALDAYSRAIRINPYISEVWFDLGSLYESCNNQISDAIDAYGRAAELDPYNPHIKQRLELLKSVQENGGALPAAPGPQDVHPTAYATAPVPPGIPGPAGHPLGVGPPPPGQQQPGGRLLFPGERPSGDPNALPAPPVPVPPARHNSPGPFRGGPPPPVIIDDSHGPSSQHTQLAPMEVDRPNPGSAREMAYPARNPLHHHGHGSPPMSPQGYPRASPRTGYQRSYVSPRGYPPVEASPRITGASDHFEHRRDDRKHRERERDKEIPYNSHTPRTAPRETTRIEEWDSRRVAPLPPSYTPATADPPPPPTRRQWYDPIHHENALSPADYKSGLKSIPSSIPRPGSQSPHADQRKRLRKDQGESTESRRERRRKSGHSSRRTRDPSTDFGAAPMTQNDFNAQQPPPSPALSSAQRAESPAPIIRPTATRPVDENYDEGVADALIGLSNNRSIDGSPNGRPEVVKDDMGGRRSVTSPLLPGVKRAHSPHPHEIQDMKRARMDSRSGIHSRSPPSLRQRSPEHSSRPSPTPFRIQASPEITRSAEMDKDASSNGPSSRGSPTSPRAGGSPPRRNGSSGVSSNAPITLPPIRGIPGRSNSRTPSDDDNNSPNGAKGENRPLTQHLKSGSPRVLTPLSASSKPSSGPVIDGVSPGL